MKMIRAFAFHIIHPSILSFPAHSQLLVLFEVLMLDHFKTSSMEKSSAFGFEIKIAVGNVELVLVI